MSFAEGVRSGLPFVLMIVPFGAIFGLVATEAGLPILQVMVLSALVIAGASQITAIGLMEQGAPAAVVLFASLAVNLRMAMYSASLAPWIGGAPLWQRATAAYLLVDQVYVLSIARYEAEPRAALGARMAYYAGVAAPVVPGWYGATLMGALFGDMIPDALSAEAIVPVVFAALLAPLLRTKAHLAAALASSVLAVLLSGLPWSLGLPVAAISAMLVGSEIERRGA